MRKCKKKKKAEKRANVKKVIRIILEVGFMVLGILCTIMPAPFPLLVPIFIGSVRIISSAIRKDKASAPAVYCNGVQEPPVATKKQPRQSTKTGKSRQQAQRKKVNDSDT